MSTTDMIRELCDVIDVLNISFEPSFVLENGKEIKIVNRTDCF